MESNVNIEEQQYTTTKDNIKKLFNDCIDKAITTISIYDLKQYCINNRLLYQSMYVLFRRIHTHKRRFYR